MGVDIDPALIVVGASLFAPHPTDPVVASTLVTGPLAEHNIPRRLRRTLQIESGANDGLALPVVLLAVFMLTKSGGGAVGDWALEAATEIGLAVAIGLTLGYAAGKLTELSLRASEMEQPNLLGVGLALALLTLGLVHELGGSGILAVFVVALMFSVLLRRPLAVPPNRVRPPHRLPSSSWI
jgi:sodium/hydrogen antiporter